MRFFQLSISFYNGVASTCFDCTDSLQYGRRWRSVFDRKNKVYQSSILYQQCSKTVIRAVLLKTPRVKLRVINCRAEEPDVSTPTSFITFETRVTITFVSASYQGARLVSLLESRLNPRDRCPRCSWVVLKRLHSTFKQFELSDPGSSCVLTGTDVRLFVSRYSV